MRAKSRAKPGKPRRRIPRNRSRPRRQLLPWLGLLLFLLSALLLLHPEWRPSWPFRDRGPVVIVDAGHGGVDPGASNPSTLEKDLSLDVALRVRDRLLALGHRVKMTRESDLSVSLPERTALSNAEREALFVSIHFNKSENPAASGIETYFYQREPDTAAASELLAAEIQTTLIARTGATDRGIKSRGFHVLRNNRHPAVLVECGFLSHTMEATLIRRDGYRQSLAESIAEGIHRFLQTPPDPAASLQAQ